MRFAAVLFFVITVTNALSLESLNIFHKTEADRVIKTGPESYEIVSEADKLRYKRNGVRFIDITQTISIEDAVAQGLVIGPGKGSILTVFSQQLSALKAPVAQYNYPKVVQKEDLVKLLFDRIDIDGVKKNLAKFSSFYTRYYKSATGLESAEWLHGKIAKVLKGVPGATIKKIKHDGWDQFSIIASIPGKVEDKVVVGAHQDSINLLFPSLLSAPGADDDGSGTVTTLESLRIIAEAIEAGEFQPYNTLEFHYYSAEEGGLLGSIDVFSQYFANNETVVGMLQQDMTGYSQGSIDLGIEPHFGLITDYTTAGQNEFIKVVASSYCALPIHETKCGYACSDHASALENGYPASFMIESEFKYTSRFIHSTMDTLDRLDFGHVNEHIKLTIGYAVELSAAKHLRVI